MRVFIAINPPPEVRRSALRAASEMVRELGEGVRWTRPENVHITLKFLGEVPEEDLQGISSALDAACSTLAPFEARLRGIGAFPSPHRARTIWAGVGEGSGEMSVLATSVGSALEPRGFPREERRYVPHATLGRAKGSSSILGLPEEGVLRTPVFRVSSIRLIKSSLTPRGSVYETVEAFTLRGRGR